MSDTYAHDVRCEHCGTVFIALLDERREGGAEALAECRNQRCSGSGGVEVLAPLDGVSGPTPGALSEREP